MRKGKPVLKEKEHIRMELEAHEEPLEQKVRAEEPVHDQNSDYALPISEAQEFFGPDAVFLNQETINKAVAVSSKLFGYNREQRKAVKNELKTTEFDEDTITEFLGYFITGKVPEGFFVLNDGPMRQTYFVSREIPDYLTANFSRDKFEEEYDPLAPVEEFVDIDLSDPQTAIMHMRDNPNVVCQEIFHGRVVVATLEKVFSGKDLRKVGANTLFSDYRNKPERSSHHGEHLLEQYSKIAEQ